MISQAVEYSLRAMVMLAKAEGRPETVKNIAEVGKIPAPYLSKLLQGLTRAGLITSQRGIGGGYVLARPAAEITLAHIVNEVEPLQRINRCPVGIKGHIQLCPLHRRLDEAMAMVEKAFCDTTLQDICDEKSGSIPLCETGQTVDLGIKV